MLNGALDQQYATYEDIYMRFVAPKISQILGISEHVPVYLYHEPCSYFDKRRLPTAGEILSGLTFYVINAEKLAGFQSLYSEQYLQNEYNKLHGIETDNEITDENTAKDWRFNNDLLNTDIRQRLLENVGDPLTSASLVSSLQQFLQKGITLGDTIDGEKQNNKWLDDYNAHINNSSFIIDNSGDNASMTKAIIGARKFIDPTIMARAVIRNIQELSFSEYQDLIEKLLILSNLDSLLIPITLTNINVLNNSNINTVDHKFESAFIKLSDLQEIGIFEIEQGSILSMISIQRKYYDLNFSKDDISSIIYEYDEYVDTNTLNTLLQFNRDLKLIPDDVTPNITVAANQDIYISSMAKIKKVSSMTDPYWRTNIYNFQSFYTENRDEQLSFTLTECLMTTRPNYTGPSRLADMIDILNTGSSTLQSLRSSLKNIGASGYMFYKKTDEQQDQTASTISDDNNALTSSIPGKYVKQKTTGATISTATPAYIQNTAQNLSSLSTGMDNGNIQTKSIDVALNSKIDIAALKSLNDISMLNEAGAYIIPFKIYGEFKKNTILPVADTYVSWLFDEPLSYNSIIPPNTYDGFYPVFNGPNLNPGKRAALFTLTQDRTGIETQLMIEQYGPAVEIILEFGSNFERIFPDLYTEMQIVNGTTIPNDILTVNFQENAGVTLESFQDLFVVNALYMGSGSTSITIKIKYNTYDLTIPNALKYITLQIFSSESVHAFTPNQEIPYIMSVKYNGITSENVTYNRTLLYCTGSNKNDNDMIYNAWIENRTADADGNSYDITKIIGTAAPMIWEQSDVFIAAYIYIIQADNTPSLEIIP